MSIRGTAHHEAGHAVVSLELGRAVKRVSIVEDVDSLGRSERYAVGEWFRPDIEIDSRTTRRIQDEVMIGWAGTLAEERAGDVTADALEIGAIGDVAGIVNLASYVTGSTEETEAYIEWLRLRTRSLLGRLLVWPKVEAVAAALLAARTLSGRRVREVAQATAAEWLEARSLDAR